MTALTLAIPLKNDVEQDLPSRAEPADLDEYRLIRKARNGDLQAFERLYRLFVPRVFGLCRRMVGDVALAEELTQEVFCRSWAQIPRLREPNRVAGAGRI